MSAAVEVVDLGKSYGESRALDGVSLGWREVSVLAVLGPNGAGKTTTIEICEGFRRPTPGRCGCSAGRPPIRRCGRGSA